MMDEICKSVYFLEWVEKKGYLRSPDGSQYNTLWYAFC